MIPLEVFRFMLRDVGYEWQLTEAHGQEWWVYGEVIGWDVPRQRSKLWVMYLVAPDALRWTRQDIIHVLFEGIITRSRKVPTWT